VNVVEKRVVFGSVLALLPTFKHDSTAFVTGFCENHGNCIRGHRYKGLMTFTLRLGHGERDEYLLFVHHDRVAPCRKVRQVGERRTSFR
jgi:hypothetical protein